MNSDERDNLSDLLGRVPARKPSPAFVQNVVRAVRMSEPEREPGFVEWLTRGWNWAAFAGAAAAVVLIAVGTNRPEFAGPETVSLATHDTAAVEEALQSADLAVLNNFDILLALDDKNPWLESSLP